MIDLKLYVWPIFFSYGSKKSTALRLLFESAEVGNIYSRSKSRRHKGKTAAGLCDLESWNYTLVLKKGSDLYDVRRWSEFCIKTNVECEFCPLVMPTCLITTTYLSASFKQPRWFANTKIMMVIITIIKIKDKNKSNCKPHGSGIWMHVPDCPGLFIMNLISLHYFMSVHGHNAHGIIYKKSTGSYLRRDYI